MKRQTKQICWGLCLTFKLIGNDHMKAININNFLDIKVEIA